MKQFDTTEAIYESELQHYLGEIGVAPDEAYTCRPSVYLSAHLSSTAVPTGKARSITQGYFIGMGIDLMLKRISILTLNQDQLSRQGLLRALEFR